MSITIFTGLPGSGKSETLIARVHSALQEGRISETIMCGDSPVLRARPGIAVRGMMGCRSGLTTPLNHFVSVGRALELVADAPPDSLLAFDEAHYFGHQLVQSWCVAADRGVEILIASPSVAQLKALKKRGHEASRLRLTCQICRERDASDFFCHLDDDRTESVCDDCFQRAKTETKAEVVRRLHCSPPNPGEECIYQPIELPEFSSWNVIRRDSEKRFRIIRDICASQGLPGMHSTYLDVGCNTGFFCHQMYKVGFRSTGVDVTVNDIEVARLLSTYFRRDYASYVVSDAHAYLQSTHGQLFDVTSAFSVFQWVMIQKTPAHGLDCMRWLFRKTGRICILEMGTSTEAHYIKRIGMKFDSAWVYEFMQSQGGFDRIEIVDHRSNGIKRDLLVGHRERTGDHL